MRNVTMSAPTVLIVDDDELLRELTAQLVEDIGGAPLLAGNADEALALLKNGTDIAVMITDVQMPGSMDGLALAKIVQRRWPSIQLIVVSGNTNPTKDQLPVGAIFLSNPYATVKHL